MKSFGIGLALLVSGFAAYIVTSTLLTLFRVLEHLRAAGVIPAGVTLPEGWETWATGGIPLSVLYAVPYICLGIMFFGFAWFWAIEPLLYLTSPPKKEKEVWGKIPHAPSPMKEFRAEPAVPSKQELARWIAEAILEKLERERGR